MKLTTQSIISTLPLSGDHKKELLANLDSYPLEKKYAIEKLLWDTYDNIFESRYEENKTQIFLDTFDRSDKPDDAEINKRAYEKTEAEMVKGYEKVASKDELTAVREKLQSMIEENKADAESTPQPQPPKVA